MEMLAHHQYESMISSTPLVYRRSHMCRFECNVEYMCGGIISAGLDDWLTLSCTPFRIAMAS